MKAKTRQQTSYLMLLILSAATVFVLYPIVNKPTVLLHRARILADQGKTARSDALVFEAVKAGGRQPSAVVHAAEVLLAKGRPDAAAELVREALHGRRSIPAGIARRMAGLFDARGETALALEVILSVRDEIGRDERLYLADLLRREERFDESLAVYRTLLADDPSDFEVALRRVETLTWQGDLQTALPLARELVGSAPDNRKARLLLARILAWSGHADEAEKEYRRLLGEQQ